MKTLKPKVLVLIVMTGCLFFKSSILSAQLLSSTIQEDDAAIDTKLRVNYSSAYIFRGVTRNRNSVVQPSIEIIASNQAQFGVWGNFPADSKTDEIDQEVDVYLRYAVPFGFGKFVIGVWEYLYPKDDLENDREIEATLAGNFLLNPVFSAFVGIDGGAKNREYYEFSLNQNLLTYKSLSFGVGGEIGYLRPQEGNEGFSHGLVSIASGYDILQASANWLFEMNERVNDLDLASQERFYLSVGTGYTF